MPDGRRNNRGTKGNKGGRPAKADEQKLVEKLTPIEPTALKKLFEAIEDGEKWAIELFMKYKFGMPKQFIETENNNKHEVNIPILSWVDGKSN